MKYLITKNNIPNDVLYFIANKKYEILQIDNYGECYESYVIVNEQNRLIRISKSYMYTEDSIFYSIEEQRRIKISKIL